MDTANGPSEKANESTTEGGEMGANDQRLLAPSVRDHRSQQPKVAGEYSHCRSQCKSEANNQRLLALTADEP